MDFSKQTIALNDKKMVKSKGFIKYKYEYLIGIIDHKKFAKRYYDTMRKYRLSYYG